MVINWNKDVLNLIFQYASTLDYQTCCSIRLTSKLFAESDIIKEHLYAWCLIEGIDMIEDINKELLGPRPKFKIPFIENDLYSDIVLLIGDRYYKNFIQMKYDFISFKIEGFNDSEIRLKILVSYRPMSWPHSVILDSDIRTTYSVIFPKNRKIDVKHSDITNITEIFIPSLCTTASGWDVN
jgi:hypothetical protein